MSYTKIQMDILLWIRKHPRPAAAIKKKFKLSDNSLNANLSKISDLFYRDSDSRNIWDGKLHLNEIGETVAQAEFDRRFDMYFTRIMALLALAASIVAIILQAV